MKKTITIMYFTDNTGKVRTIEVSVKSLVWIIAGIAILLLISITGSIISFKLYIDKSKLNNELALVNVEKKSLEVRIKDLETKKASIEKELDKRETEMKTISKKEVITKEAEKITIIKKADAMNKEAGKKSADVSISNFQIKKDIDKFTVSFDILKTNSAGEAFNGYFLILADYGGKYVSFPEGAEVKDGLVIDFKKGEKFIIKWQKQVERIFPYTEDNSIKMITVFVYSENGNILIKKEARL